MNTVKKSSLNISSDSLTFLGGFTSVSDSASYFIPYQHVTYAQKDYFILLCTCENSTKFKEFLQLTLE